MPASNAISLIIGGREHRDWLSYEIDSDLLTPADGWRVSLGLPADAIPDTVQPWAQVTLRLGDDIILSGRIDSIERSIRKGEHTLMLTGRDDAAVLVDCSAPIFSARQMCLEDVAALLLKPLGLSSTEVFSNAVRHEKVAIEPIMTAWDALQELAEANGVWPWFDADGTLVLGGPDYSATHIGGLVLRFDGLGNNVLVLSVQETTEGRYSEVTVLGQSHGTETADGAHDIKAVVRDASVTWYRPLIVVDPDCDSVDIAKRRARKLLTDGRLSLFTIMATVRGHRVCGDNTNGVPWKPGQRVRVYSEPHGIDGTYFLMQRTFISSKSQGQITELTLKEDGVWLPDGSTSPKLDFLEDAS